MYAAFIIISLACTGRVRHGIQRAQQDPGDGAANPARRSPTGQQYLMSCFVVPSVVVLDPTWIPCIPYLFRNVVDPDSHSEYGSGSTLDLID